jgi:hypothetical protein
MEKQVQAINNSPAQLLQIAVENGADVDKLGKLMDMQERWNAAQAKRLIFIRHSQDFSQRCQLSLKRSQATILSMPRYPTLLSRSSHTYKSMV